MEPRHSWKIAVGLLAFLGLAYPAIHFTGGNTRAAASLLSSSNKQTLEQRARSALSVTNGTLKLSGLEHSVTVFRDPWGVPHIYARNQHDLFFAQGFVAAQDRLFQMELWKRVGQGRLAEVFGPAYLERDINARRLAYRGSLADDYASSGGLHAGHQRRNCPAHGPRWSRPSTRISARGICARTLETRRLP